MAASVRSTISGSTQVLPASTSSMHSSRSAGSEVLRTIPSGSRSSAAISCGSSRPAVSRMIGRSSPALRNRRSTSMPGAVGHVDVEQHEIRLELVDLGQGFLAGPGAADETIVGPAKQHLQRGGDHRMVVGEEDVGHAAAPASGRLIEMSVRPGCETSMSEPCARSTRSFSDHGSTSDSAVDRREARGRCR